MSTRGAPLVNLARLAQDGVPGLGEHVSPLVPVHRLAPSFSQPYTLLYPSSFLVGLTFQDLTIFPVHDVVFLTTVF